MACRHHLRHPRRPQRRALGLLLLEGVVDIAAGAVAVLWPAITLVALIWVIAVWAIISGALMLGAAFGLNIDHGRWWLALGGIASIIFGVLLVIEPLVGAVVLTMCSCAYAVVFGGVLLAVARLPAPFEARSAVAESPGWREEGLMRRGERISRHCQHFLSELGPFPAA